MGADRERGVLYPSRLPDFHRIEPDPGVRHAVRWFWIPEWDLAPGERSVQRILPFPACNLVVEPAGVTLAGPPTRPSERVLVGRGWAVGALLRPAAAPGLAPELRAITDQIVQVQAPGLHRTVHRAMTAPDDTAEERRARAVAAFSDWLLQHVPAPATATDAEIANRLEVVLADPAITRTDQLPPLLHVSARTLQRLAERHFGLSLHSMIRRRRLQEAAQLLRERPQVTIASVAAQLGYSDQAHFANDFKVLLGLSPSDYRRSV